MIVLVDDDADQRLAVRMALELAGYQVREAANGTQALALQRSRASPILVTDIFMPETDGLETIAAFRREFPATRIVAVSGGGQRAKGDYLAAARLMGVDATLEKPYDVERLLAIVRQLSDETR